MGKIADIVKEAAPEVRYVAVNSGGDITEMEQFVPSNNPSETDRMEELLVNPIILEMTARRGNLDLGGVDWVVIRYGMQYQGVLAFRDGHVSVGIDFAHDPVRVMTAVSQRLSQL